MLLSESEQNEVIILTTKKPLPKWLSPAATPDLVSVKFATQGDDDILLITLTDGNVVKTYKSGERTNLRGKMRRFHPFSMNVSPQSPAPVHPIPFQINAYSDKRFHRFSVPEL